MGHIAHLSHHSLYSTRCNYNWGDYKVSQTKHGLQWDRVNFSPDLGWVGLTQGVMTFIQLDAS